MTTVTVSTPELALWRAVIHQAITDAGHQSVDDNHDADRAAAWLRNGRGDFKQVCILAGLDPDYVREKVALRIGRKGEYRMTRQTRRKTKTPAREFYGNRN